MSKILVVINNLGAGGAERLVIDDINEMLERGLDVYLLTFGMESEKTISKDCKLQISNWTTIQAKSIWDIKSWFAAYLYIRKIKPDKIFSHLWFSNTIVLPVARLAGISNIVSFEHNVYDSVKNSKMFFVDRLWQNFPKKIVAVSSAVKDSLVGHGIQPNRVEVIHNGIKLEKYNIVKNLELRNEFIIPKDSFVFVSVGRLIKQKGMDILIEAFSRDILNAHLLIVGVGESMEILQELASQKKVIDRVHFLGIRHDVEKILSISDCFVLASRWEGLGIVVLEAMASKMPIIISDFEAGKDIIDNGNSGVIVPRENPDILYLEMKRVMEDESLRQNLSQNAFTKVQSFSIENHVSKILSL